LAVLVVGRGSGIAPAIVDAAVAEGAHVIAAGRNQGALEAAYKDTPASVKSVDVTDETYIAALADEAGSIHHVVSTVSARARGAVKELSPEAILLSHTKVVGFAPKVPRTGSFVLFSGVSALSSRIPDFSR
jgi:NAD(P)-dependent dehydrogenase (short-subunit alcohol dehydrogenase family)